MAKPNLLILDEPTNHLDLEMRHALTMALQLYKGALIIISHDRHLLKNTVDQFYLVAQQTLQFFDGDLSDYQHWLRENLQKTTDSDNSTATKSSTNDTKIDKKQQRQQEAEKRQQLKPLTNLIKQIERKMEKEQAQLADIEEQLADETIYADEHKKTLQDLLLQQGKLSQSLEQLEEQWLETHEEIEQFQS